VGSGESEDDDSGADSAADAGPVDGPTNFTAIIASDWLPIAGFENQVTAMHLNFDADEPARFIRRVWKTPCDLFLAFFPLELVGPSFQAWREHAAEHDRKGLSNLDKSMFMRFLDLVLRMDVIGLRRRDHYFKDPSSPMTQLVFQNLLKRLYIFYHHLVVHLYLK
jgi:hypothetical protein